MVRRRNQRGTTLVIALALLLLLGTVVPAIIGLSYTGASTTTGSVRDRTSLYAATSAVEAAIQYGRLTAWVGRFGAPCPTIATQVGGSSPSVTCTSSTGPFDLDRTVTFSATVDGRLTTTATVRYGDGSSGGATPSVTVLSWNSRAGAAS